MSKAPARMKLGAFLMATGHHVAGWRHPLAQADAGQNFAHYKALAQRAERARFDAVFVADSLAILDNPPRALARVARSDYFEPLTLLSALSAVTERIGLIATVTTTYNEPYHVARKFASLDHLSGGRAGWNMVTSSNAGEAWNFGGDAHLDIGLRYRRASEFVSVVTGLWDSWEDDAFVRDKASGVYLDPARMHRLDHHGEHFDVRGPLNIARPVQGYPVLVQAGASEAGLELAARSAEVVFTAQPDLERALAFHDDVKGRLARHGRHPGQVKIMPGLFPVVGRTLAEAEEKFAALQALVDPVVGLSLLSDIAGGVDLSAYPLDGPLPDLPPTNSGLSRQQLLVDLARREHLTIRQLYQRMATARGHRVIVGTARMVADEMEAWFTQGAADGFNIMPPHLPGGLDDFADLVVPELQRRGLFRTEYEGRTLRENLGLARPVNRRAAAAAGKEANKETDKETDKGAGMVASEASNERANEGERP